MDEGVPAAEVVRSLEGNCRVKSIEGCCHRKTVNDDVRVEEVVAVTLSHEIGGPEEEACDCCFGPCFGKDLENGR